MSDLERAAAEQLRSPDLPPDRLMAIAAEFPMLWPIVAQHPNAYPELIAWIAAQDQARVQTQSQVHESQVSAVLPPVEDTLASFAAVPAESPDSALAEPAAAPRSLAPRRARTMALFSGIGIGLVAGAALSAVLLLWVLPGLFGSTLG